MARQAFSSVEGGGSVAPWVGAERGARLEWLRATPSWALSAAIHLAVILILISVVREVRVPERDSGPIRIRVEPAPVAPPVEGTVGPWAPTGPIKIPKAPLPPAPVPTGPVVVEPAVELRPPEGNPRNDGSTGADAWIPHAFGPNLSLGPKGGLGGRAGVKEGSADGGFLREGPLGWPPEGVRDAVQAALEWLRRHQSPDGAWRSRDWVQMCRTPCRNAGAAGAGDGRGFPDHDVGVTGLAVLAFSGWGHTHLDGTYAEYVECVRRAVLYLKGVQVRSEDPNEDGRFGPARGEQWVYDHAIATLALAELLVVTGDVIGLQRPVEAAVGLCLRARNEGLAWRYGIRPGDNDSSVTGWMVLALKTARAARLDVPDRELQDALGGALRWFHRTTSAAGKTGYLAPGDEGSRLNGVHHEPYPFSKEPSSMTAVAVLSRLFAGEGRGSRDVQRGVKLLLESPPRWQEPRGRALSTVNFYYWYYASYALFLHGGKEEWKKWEDAMVPALLKSQRQGGDPEEDGSWDPIDEWGPAGGRVYSTALGAMTLEVYQRARRAR
ncbi:MAG: hypothetical protein HY721_01265 [Planctomycetes bacterium]|nr:hypothetical protein [Planctomycetota bacterium]